MELILLLRSDLPWSDVLLCQIYVSSLEIIQNFLLFISSCIANSKQRVSFPWCCFRKWAIKFGDFNCRKYKQAISEKLDKINTCYSLILIIKRKYLSDRGNVFRCIRRFGWCCLDLVQILTIGYWRILNSNVKFR